MVKYNKHGQHSAAHKTNADNVHLEGLADETHRICTINVVKHEVIRPPHSNA